MTIGTIQSPSWSNTPLTKLENYFNAHLAPWTPQYDTQTGQAIAGTGGVQGVVNALTGKSPTGSSSSGSSSFFGIDMVDIVLVAVGLIIIVTAALKLLGDSTGAPTPVQSVMRGAKRVHAFGTAS